MKLKAPNIKNISWFSEDIFFTNVIVRNTVAARADHENNPPRGIVIKEIMNAEKQLRER